MMKNPHPPSLHRLHSTRSQHSISQPKRKSYLAEYSPALLQHPITGFSVQDTSLHFGIAWSEFALLGHTSSDKEGYKALVEICKEG
jgi:hypothetical protein